MLQAESIFIDIFIGSMFFCFSDFRSVHWIKFFKHERSFSKNLLQNHQKTTARRMCVHSQMPKDTSASSKKLIFFCGDLKSSSGKWRSSFCTPSKSKVLVSWNRKYHTCLAEGLSLITDQPPKCLKEVRFPFHPTRHMAATTSCNMSMFQNQERALQMPCTWFILPISQQKNNAY